MIYPQGSQLRRLVWYAALLGAVGQGLPAAGQIWSPNGRRLAYVSQTLEPPPAGWLWFSEGDDRQRSTRWRIWSSAASGVDATLVAESPRPLRLLAWKPDGSALAYLRVTDEAEWEVVLHTGPQTERTVYRQKTEKGREKGREKGTGPICRNGPKGASHKLDLSPFPESADASAGSWSSSGNRLAFTLDEELMVLSLPDERLLAVFAGGVHPVFSPHSDHLAFYRPAPDGALVTSREPYQRTIFHLSTAATFQPAVWTDQGDALVAVRARKLPNERGEISTAAGNSGWEADVVRISVQQSTLDVLHRLPDDVVFSHAGVDSWQDIRFAFAETVDAPHLWLNQPLRVPALEARPQVQVRTCPLLADSLPVIGMTLNAQRNRLAVRYGGQGARRILAVLSLATAEQTLLAHDPGQRLAALQSLAEAADLVLSGDESRSRLPGGTLARSGLPSQSRSRPAGGTYLSESIRETWWATRLPPYAALEKLSRADRVRLDRLLAAARPLLSQDQPQDRPAPCGQDELELYFHYLLGDWTGASAALRRLDAQTLSPPARFSQLLLRAQVLFASGRPHAALALLDDLERRLTAWEAHEHDGDALVRLALIRQTLESLESTAAKQRP